MKTQGILSKHRENTGNFVSSSCKCSDSKSKGYCDSCQKKNPFFSGSRIGLPSHTLCKLAQGKCVAGQGKHREFENTIDWVPCKRLIAVFEIKGAPCVHILAAGCTDFSTCAPFVCMVYLTYDYLYIRKNTQTNCRVHSFGYLCTRRVHNMNP